MSKEVDESKGRWRTICGRKVFIEKGQSLSDAMKKSGKFSKADINSATKNPQEKSKTSACRVRVEEKVQRVKEDKDGTKTEEANKAENGKKKMTPDEKIASVHIDFDSDNMLPELNEEDLMELGIKENKQVRLKKLTIDRNMLKHYDISPKDSEVIIGKALYSTGKQIIPNKDKSKPNYYSFASFVRVSRKSKKDIFGVVMIDIDDKKDAFEIVHWHYVPYDKLGNIKGE